MPKNQTLYVRFEKRLNVMILDYQVLELLLVGTKLLNLYSWIDQALGFLPLD
jgi:hypothetical protein